ncbi:MAG: peptidylprolyl isomerase, partial [Gammaproteobacteria bacterium]|nr:peptidylprolyl isomerase [Gammaproteobacteria bacterium]
MLSFKSLKTKSFLSLFLFSSMFLAQSVKATIVQFETPFGNFEVNLYDEKAPKTVANFLSYVNDGDYSNTVFHRSVSGFIVQGGGFIYNGSMPLDTTVNKGSVRNEPVFSNVRGTIAMAKLANDPNSASNQWFFNLA